MLLVQAVYPASSVLKVMGVSVPGSVWIKGNIKIYIPSQVPQLHSFHRLFKGYS